MATFDFNTQNLIVRITLISAACILLSCSQTHVDFRHGVVLLSIISAYIQGRIQKHSVFPFVCHVTLTQSLLLPDSASVDLSSLVVIRGLAAYSTTDRDRRRTVRSIRELTRRNADRLRNPRYSRFEAGPHLVHDRALRSIDIAS